MDGHWAIEHILLDALEGVAWQAPERMTDDQFSWRHGKASSSSQGSKRMKSRSGSRGGHKLTSSEAGSATSSPTSTSSKAIPPKGLRGSQGTMEILHESKEEVATK